MRIYKATELFTNKYGISLNRPDEIRIGMLRSKIRSKLGQLMKFWRDTE